MHKVAILRNENDQDHLDWMIALDKRKDIIEYDIVDLTAADWLNQIQRNEYDMLLTRAPGITSYYKQLYDERIYIIQSQLKKDIYPTLDEIYIYENKRLLSYWLEANEVPHPQTYVFYNKQEALQFIKKTKYPFVAKTIIGGSGSGVKIIKSKGTAKEYLNKAFSGKGIGRRWWPNLKKANLNERIWNRLKHFRGSINHFQSKRNRARSDIQKYFVIFQEFVDIVDEWRCVYIGGNYFGHKKEKKGELISGGGGIIWDYPDESLLEFMKKVVEKGKMEATSLDVLVTKDGDFLVNEIQAFFGFIHPDYQMTVEGKPGKFIRENEKWAFVEGIFNRNNSYDLRVDHVIELLEKSRNIRGKQ